MVGNGMQHLEGRLETMAELDANCEAALYQEMAHQELGMNKHEGLQVRFRQQLEWLWCVDFKRYMMKHRPVQMALWKELNPDVPQLLDIFADYVAAQNGYRTAQKE